MVTVEEQKSEKDEKMEYFRGGELLVLRKIQSPQKGPHL
jgi:hypothetical protein